MPIGIAMHELVNYDLLSGVPIGIAMHELVNYDFWSMIPISIAMHELGLEHKGCIFCDIMTFLYGCVQFSLLHRMVLLDYNYVVYCFSY